jgi:RNA polymerase sigma-70 factor (ECF subfamily)
MNSTRRSEPTIDRAEQATAAFVERLRALDEHAWAELYDQHHAQIYRYAYGRTGSREAAEDVAAQTFTEALTSIRRYQYKGRPILAWLYRIARNLAAKQARQRREREIPDGYVEPGGGSLEEGLDSIALMEALRRLTAEQREVVALRFYAGYSTREIALAMGKREAAVYSLEVRAIAALRRQFAEEARDFPLQADENSPLTGINQVR